MIDQSNDIDDDKFRHLLNPIRAIEAPLGLEARCLEAARDCLKLSNKFDQGTANAARHKQLYIAVAASLLIGASIGWMARGQTSASAMVDASNAVVQPKLPAFDLEASKPSELADAKSAVDFQDSADNPVFITREFYLCGVGRIQSKSELVLKGQ